MDADTPGARIGTGVEDENAELHGEGLLGVLGQCYWDSSCGCGSAPHEELPTRRHRRRELQKST